MYGLLKMISGKEITIKDFLGLLYIFILLLIIYGFTFGTLFTIIKIAPIIQALG